MALEENMALEHGHTSIQRPTGSGSPNGPGELLFLGADDKLAPVQSSRHGSGAGGSTSSYGRYGGSAGGLQINLIWDSSVASAPAGFMQAAIAAAQLYTTEFSDPEVINIQVGYGEVAGQRLPSGALAASESYGYSETYSQVAAALQQDASSSTWQ